MNINIGIADDHQLFCKSLGVLINSYHGFEVVFDALNGEELLRRLAAGNTIPDVLLVDVTMPVMDGPRTVERVLEKYPWIRIAALSMKDDELSMIRMIKAGCCAYLLKDIHPNELERALTEIHVSGHYNGDKHNIHYRRLIKRSGQYPQPCISTREKEFLKLACSDLTYKQIAAVMFLAERTIDGYRESLFEKLNVKSRVGMVMEALRHDLVFLQRDRLCRKTLSTV